MSPLTLSWISSFLTCQASWERNSMKEMGKCEILQPLIASVFIMPFSDLFSFWDSTCSPHIHRTPPFLNHSTKAMDAAFSSAKPSSTLASTPTPDYYTGSYAEAPSATKPTRLRVCQLPHTCRERYNETEGGKARERSVNAASTQSLTQD